MRRYGLYIGGEDVDAASGETFEALNPTTETNADKRELWLDRLEWKDGKPIVDGPTCDPQPGL